MGCGSWTSASYADYSSRTKIGATLDSSGVLRTSLSNQEMFKARDIDPALDPKNVIRECCDNDEHPNTVPVVLALDLTGSMGNAAVEVAKKLNVVMTELYDKISDVEFMIMGIGDFSYDDAPLQVSQFESDIRIAEQLDKLYFEFGGGGNNYESYTGAWYFGSRHTNLDCWKRGKRGIIITMGDELLNPYLPYRELSDATGDNLQADVETNDLYKEASKKFDIYHLNVDHKSGFYTDIIEESWKKCLGEDKVKTVNINGIAEEIISIILNSQKDQQTVTTTNNEISW